MMRLDAFLAASGGFGSRARAQAAIRAGKVRVNGAPALKPSANIAAEDIVESDGDAHQFVSRGGVKLAAALDAFSIEPAGLVCLDLGASTGGFTDVLVRAGARKVYAVDVGADQLALALRDDARVLDLQKTHAKDLTSRLIPEPIEMIVCDVSFISLRKALPPALALAGRGARLVALVKPQFEVGRGGIGKGGIVKQGHQYAEGVAEGVSDWLEREQGWRAAPFIESPIAGGDGNREFLIAAQKRN